LQNLQYPVFHAPRPALAESEIRTLSALPARPTILGATVCQKPNGAIGNWISDKGWEILLTPPKGFGATLERETRDVSPNSQATGLVNKQSNFQAEPSSRRRDILNGDGWLVAVRSDAVLRFQVTERLEPSCAGSASSTRGILLEPGLRAETD
jgi:hypothetical protein